MTTKNNGGPAFSGTYSARSDQGRGTVVEMHDKGMSLRDYFAAKAMQGMLAYPGDEQRGSHHNNNDADGVAQMSYAYADAMLAERAK